MDPRYNEVIEKIFEQSVIDALSYYGIDVPRSEDDSFSNYNQEHVFLREASVNKLMSSWTYSPSITTELEIVFRYDASGNPEIECNEEKLKKLVAIQ